MAEPVTLYSTKGGEPMVCAAPLEVRRLLRTEDWSLEPVPQPEPEPKTKPAAKKIPAAKD